MSSFASESRRSPSSARGAPRAIPAVESLDSLVGSHPAALHDIYGSGQVADPDGFPGHCHGRLLAFEQGADSAFMITRRLVGLVKPWLPWRGKSFESGGTSGVNRVLSFKWLRFRCEAGRSDIDGQPTLVLRYDGLGNPFPFNRLVDELRQVGDGIAIGPASLMTGGRAVVRWWWGLQR